MPTPNLNSKDYYEILGCSRSADESALKKAYRKLAVKWHPDKNPDNDEATKNFQKISEAYATLSDPKKRQMYDQYGAEGANMADNMPDGAAGGFPAGGGFGGFPGGGFGGGGGSQHHMSPEDAEMFFSHFFGSEDPFGGLGGFGGSPFMNVQTGGGPRGSRRGSAGQDPFSMMFGGGMPGGMSMGGMPGGMSMGGMPGGMSMGGMPGMNMRHSMPGNFGRQQAPSYDSIPPGTVVSLKGLRGKPELNGDRGKIVQYSPQNGRYVVQLEDSEETMAVKPSNLLQHVHVRLHGIESKPELNGKTGTIIAWNPTAERYSIYVVAQKKAVSLKPNNVILDAGTVGQIFGLMSKPELNGKWGTIKDWDRSANRYNVQLSPDKIIRVKVESIRV